MTDERVLIQVTSTEMEEAADIIERQAKVDTAFAGRRVRLVRAVVYEGTYEDIQHVLSKSMPAGRKEVVGWDDRTSRHSHDAYSITVVQGDYQLIEDDND